MCADLGRGVVLWLCQSARRPGGGSTINPATACLVYDSGDAVAIEGIDESIPNLGSGTPSTQSFVTFNLSSPIPAGDWVTIKVINQGIQFWFFVNGQVPGTAGDSVKPSGHAGIAAANFDASASVGTEFADFVVNALGGS